METDQNGDDIKDTRTLVIHCEMRTQCVHAKHLPDLKLTSSLSNQGVFSIIFWHYEKYIIITSYNNFFYQDLKNCKKGL